MYPESTMLMANACIRTCRCGLKFRSRHDVLVVLSKDCSLSWRCPDTPPRRYPKTYAKHHTGGF